MNKILISLVLLGIIGCSGSKVTIPDNRGLIDANKAEIELLKAKDKVQDFRLDNLEAGLAALDSRMEAAEGDIESNNSNIVELFFKMDNLDEDLEEMFGHFSDKVAELKKADRKNKKFLLKKVSQLRKALVKEVRSRKLADNELEDELDYLEEDLEDLSRRLDRDEFIVYYAFSYLNRKLNNLEGDIDEALGDLDNRLDTVEGDISSINAEISTINNTLVSLGNQITSNNTNLLLAINTISLTPGPQGEQGIQGLPGINGENGADGEDGVDGSDGDDASCSIDFRNMHSHSSKVYADVYAVCGSNEYKLKSHVKLQGSN